ncbi:hypothetical protein BJ973_006838 [Actinoplanes tereljensis]
MAARAEGRGQHAPPNPLPILRSSRADLAATPQDRARHGRHGTDAWHGQRTAGGALYLSHRRSCGVPARTSQQLRKIGPGTDGTARTRGTGSGPQAARSTYPTADLAEFPRGPRSNSARSGPARTARHGGRGTDGAARTARHGRRGTDGAARTARHGRRGTDGAARTARHGRRGTGSGPQAARSGQPTAKPVEFPHGPRSNPARSAAARASGARQSGAGDTLHLTHRRSCGVPARTSQQLRKIGPGTARTARHGTAGTAPHRRHGTGSRPQAARSRPTHRQACGVPARTSQQPRKVRREQSVRSEPDCFSPRPSPILWSSRTGRTGTSQDRVRVGRRGRRSAGGPARRAS